MQARRAKLRDARARQAELVAERAEQKRWTRAARREPAAARVGAGARSPRWRRRSAAGRRSSSAGPREARRGPAARAVARRQSREPADTETDYVGDSGDLDDVPAPPARYTGVVGIAMQYLGVPYVWGGSSPAGFDCSGFVMYVYAQVGVSLPHNAAMQYSYGVAVAHDQLEAGDLVFFHGLGHMGIYIGGDQFIHAPHTGDVVKISTLS